MMASDLSSGYLETIDVLDDEKEEGEISLEDVSSSEEGGMGHLTSSYVVSRTRACPDCKSWGECATWCNATYYSKSQSRRDPVKGKENRHYVRDTGCTTTKHAALTLQEKNDDLVSISSDSDMEIVGLTDTSNRSKVKVKKKKRKKKDYEPLSIDDLISPSSIDLSIADGTLKVYREANPVHRSSGRSKISRSPIRRYRSPVVARSSFQSSRSPQNHSRSPIQKRSLWKVRSPKRSPRYHSPVRVTKRPLPSPPPSTRFHVDRYGDVTRLLKKVKHLGSIGTHASEPSATRNKESSLKEKLSNMLKRTGNDDHAVYLKGKSKIESIETISDADDEEDLALLRQKALETKQKKSNKSSDHSADVESEKRSVMNNDDQDEEALQLRMIALRSAVMKKHQNRVQRGIKTKRSTRSESPFSSSFLDDIPVPGDELLKYASPPCTPSPDSNHIEDMDLDTDVEREKEKLPYSPTDKITENVPIDTAMLGIEPSDVSFINVNETISSPVFDDTQDELATNSMPYYDETCLPYQVLPTTQYCSYSPSQYGSETYHPDFNDTTGKGSENSHGDNVVCDLIDGICCQERAHPSMNVVPDASHALPVSKNLFAPSVSPQDTLVSSVQMQQPTNVEQPTNDDIVFVNVNSAFRKESAYEMQTIPEYSVTDAPITTTYVARYTESMSPNESMITIEDLPENDTDPLSSLNVILGDDRNLPTTEYIPKEQTTSCQTAVEEPLHMQGVPDVTKDTNKIPTLINRTLVPAPILKSNKYLQKHETSHPESVFNSAEMQPVTVTTTDVSSSVFKPIKLQLVKKSTPVLSAPVTFENSNESLDMSEDQKGSPGKDHEAVEPEQLDVADAPSTNSEIALTQDKNQKCVRNCHKSFDSASFENERSPCSNANANKDTNIVDASVLDRQTATESDQTKSNDNTDTQESSTRNGESLRLQNDTQESVNSDDMIKKRDREENNHTALSSEYCQEQHIESHCLSTNPAPDNSDSSVSDKTVNMMKSDSNRRQSVDEDENELRAILLASLKRTKSTDTSPSVVPIISVTNSVATNVQTPALKTFTMPSTANVTCTGSNNAPPLPSKPLLTLSETLKKVNNVSISVPNGSRKRSGSVDTAKSLPKKVTRKALTSTKVVNNAKKYQNMIVQRRLNLRKLDNNASKSSENVVWSNVGAPKISHASDTERFVISLGSDTDSESEGERNESTSIPIAEKPRVHQEIPASDFEKNLNKFLRDMRTEQEQSAAAAKSFSPSTQATKQDVPQTDKGSSNMHTPLAVRHLPVSQQEEYRRLKQEILEREKLKLQRKVASNNNNNSSSNNKLSNTNVASSPVKSLPLCEKKAHIKQNQDKLKIPEKNSQKLSTEAGRKSDDLTRVTSNVCCTSDTKLSANTNFTQLQAKNNKKVIPNNLSIRISNVTTPNFTGGTRTVENSRERQFAKDKQHKSALRVLSKEEMNHKCVQVLLKPDTVERVVIISDKSALQHDTTVSVDQNENPVESDVSTKIINEKSLNNADDSNTSIFSNASTVKLLNLSTNSSVSRHEDTMETTIMLSQCEAGCSNDARQEISGDISTSVLTESSSDSNNAFRNNASENNDSHDVSRKSTIADDNTNDVWDALKKNVKTELDSLRSLPKVKQEQYLRETEHKLVARRYMVLDHLAEMSGNLRQWDMEKDVQITLANEVRKLKEQLKIAEEKLQQQRDRVNSMGPKVSTVRQKINTGRRECFKLSKICSTLGNRLMGKDYKLPEAVAQLLSDKLKEVANHTRQFTKKKRLQSNDISENSYSSLLQEISDLSKDTEENLSLHEQSTNDASVNDEMGSKSDISHLTQSNEDNSLSISETLLNFSQTIPRQSTPEKRTETSINASKHRNEEQVISLNQDSASSSEPKLYQSSPIEQNNKHTEESRTDESDPAASSELKSLANASNQYNEQNNKRASPQLPSPSPSPPPSPSPSPPPPPPPSLSPPPSPTTTTTTKTKKIAPYVSILMHLKKPKNINPHGILCPYEMMGICRDEDCQYIHQSRNQT